MTERINPKLKRRKPAVDMPSDVSVMTEDDHSETISVRVLSKGAEENSSASKYDDESSTTNGSGDLSKLARIKAQNPRLHLLHSGHWIPKQVSLGYFPIPHKNLCLIFYFFPSPSMK